MSERNLGIVREAALEHVVREGWVQRAEGLREVDSTNSWARRELAGQATTSGLHLPALFVADRQTAGRGRGEHRWWSPDGCLMMTLAVGLAQLPKSPEQWPQLALVTGLAVARTVEALSSQSVQLKWPNDVYLDGRKCAGVLIESARQDTWLIGIGLNVQVDFSMAPGEVAQRATSLHLHSPHSVTVDVALVELLMLLRDELQAWQGGSSHWMSEWQQRCLLSGRSIRVRRDQEVCQGVCQGIDDRGRLLLRTEEHGVVSLISGEVVHWA